MAASAYCPLKHYIKLAQTLVFDSDPTADIELNTMKAARIRVRVKW